MNTLIVYDSRHGSTLRLAQAIAEVLAADIRHVSKARPADLVSCQLLVIGSPSQGGFPTPAIRKLLNDTLELPGIKAAAFDTRAERSLFGFAAPKIARGLKRRGAVLLAEPQGFINLGAEGPLLEGELERAVDWARILVESGALPRISVTAI